MSDLPFILAAYGGIFGGLAIYTVALLRRLSAARQRSLRIRNEAAGADQPPR